MGSGDEGGGRWGEGWVSRREGGRRREGGGGRRGREEGRV